MGFADNGAYTIPAGATTATPGSVIASATWNSIHTDLQSALTTLGQGCPYVLASSAVVASHTGNTNETALATITIPAGALALNGILRVTCLFGGTNNGNNKTLRVRLSGIAGTAFFTNVFTTAVGISSIVHIANRNSASSQVGHAIGISGAFATGAINTAVAQDLVISGQLANGADTISLEARIVEIFRRP